MSSRRGAIAVLACCLSFAACGADDLLTSGPRDEAGVLIFYGDTARIVAPDTVDRGATFTVSFFTAAGGCTRVVAYDKITSSPGLLEIRPYDHNDGGSVCTRDLIYLKHESLVRLDASGKSVIRIVGRQRPSSGSSLDASAELSRPIFVR